MDRIYPSLGAHPSESSKDARNEDDEKCPSDSAADSISEMDEARKVPYTPGSPAILSRAQAPGVQDSPGLDFRTSGPVARQRAFASQAGPTGAARASLSFKNSDSLESQHSESQRLARNSERVTDAVRDDAVSPLNRKIFLDDNATRILVPLPR